MIIFTLLLFVISVNLDTFAIALSLCANKINIPLKSSLIIAFVTTAITVLSLLSGNILYMRFPGKFISFLGNTIIFVTGTYLLIRYFIKNHRSKNIISADIDSSGHIDSKEAFFMSFGLVINNASLGIAGGAAGINIIASGILTFVFTVLMLIFALFAGEKLNKSKFSVISEPLSAALLILLGITNIISAVL